MILLPLIRQPLLKLTHRRIGEVGKQLREIMLRVDGVAAAGAGEDQSVPVGSKASVLFCADGFMASKQEQAHKGEMPTLIVPIPPELRRGSDDGEEAIGPEADKKQPSLDD